MSRSRRLAAHHTRIRGTSSEKRISSSRKRSSFLSSHRKALTPAALFCRARVRSAEQSLTTQTVASTIRCSTQWQSGISKVVSRAVIQPKKISNQKHRHTKLSIKSRLRRPRSRTYLQRALSRARVSKSKAKETCSHNGWMSSHDSNSKCKRLTNWPQTNY